MDTTTGSLCGFCMLKDPEMHTDDGTRTFLIAIHAAPERLKPCHEHYTRYIEPIRLVLHMLGHSIGAEDEGQQESPTPPAPPLPPAKEQPSHGSSDPRSKSRTCFLCHETFRENGALGDHVRHSHNIESSELFGTRCPIDGLEREAYPRMATHIGTAHKANVPQAFQMAERMGDPHGVVKALRERSAAADPRARSA